jgi:lipopolysaccharide export system permease protein
MNILFITSSRIGDSVLSTGLLDHIRRRYPEARVHIVCGPLAVSLFEGHPRAAAIIPLKKRRYHRHWVDLWRRVAGMRWDMVVDLRNSAVSRLIWARERYVFGPHIDKSRHKVEQNAAVMRLKDVPAPKLWFSKAQEKAAEEFVSGFEGQKIIGVGPAANWAAKTWPADRFIEVLQWMRGSQGPMPDAAVAVFAAPGEEAVANTVFDSMPADSRLSGIAKFDPGMAAAVIARCDFYLGNDSGLMHCAAAAGVKTLGLFGPSYPHLYRPWGGAYVTTPQSFDELIDYPGYTAETAPCLMEGLSVEAVKGKIKKIFY